MPMPTPSALSSTPFSPSSYPGYTPLPHVPAKWDTDTGTHPPQSHGSGISFHASPSTSLPRPIVPFSDSSSPYTLPIDSAAGHYGSSHPPPPPQSIPFASSMTTVNAAPSSAWGRCGDVGHLNESSRPSGSLGNRGGGGGVVRFDLESNEAYYPSPAHPAQPSTLTSLRTSRGGASRGGGERDGEDERQRRRFQARRNSPIYAPPSARGSAGAKTRTTGGMIDDIINVDDVTGGPLRGRVGRPTAIELSSVPMTMSPRNESVGTAQWAQGSNQLHTPPPPWVSTVLPASFSAPTGGGGGDTATTVQSPAFERLQTFRDECNALLALLDDAQPSPSASQRQGSPFTGTPPRPSGESREPHGGPRPDSHTDWVRSGPTANDDDDDSNNNARHPTEAVGEKQPVNESGFLHAGPSFPSKLEAILNEVELLNRREPEEKPYPNGAPRTDQSRAVGEQGGHGGSTAPQRQQEQQQSVPHVGIDSQRSPHLRGTITAPKGVTPETSERTTPTETPRTTFGVSPPASRPVSTVAPFSASPGPRPSPLSTLAPGSIGEHVGRQSLNWVIFTVEGRLRQLRLIDDFERAREPYHATALCASTVQMAESVLQSLLALQRGLRASPPRDADPNHVQQLHQLSTLVSNALTEMTAAEEKVTAQLLNDAAAGATMERETARFQRDDGAYPLGMARSSGLAAGANTSMPQERRGSGGFRTRFASGTLSSMEDTLRQELRVTAILLQQVHEENLLLKAELDDQVHRQRKAKRRWEKERAAKEDLAAHYDRVAAENADLYWRLRELDRSFASAPPSTRARSVSSGEVDVVRDEFRRLQAQHDRQTDVVRDLREDLATAENENEVLRHTVAVLREHLARHRTVLDLFTRKRREDVLGEMSENERQQQTGSGSARERALEPSPEVIQGILNGMVHPPSDDGYWE